MAAAAAGSGKKPNPKRIFLFDVDGTLTVPRVTITEEMRAFLKSVRDAGHVLGVVGGSDFVKIKEQLGAGVLEEFTYVFAQNGLVAYKNGEKIGEQSIAKHFKPEKLNGFLNFCLQYISQLDIPVKRGTFVEFRSGMLNVSPIGRNCSHEERIAFNKYDDEHKVRAKFVKVLEEKFAEDMGLTFSIGGQISFDVFPNGWDKTFCLQFLHKDGFADIHFFGDKVYKGGNDHEIYESDKTTGHAVKSPDDTRRILGELVGIK